MAEDKKGDEARDAVSAASRGELATQGVKGLRELVESQESAIARALPMAMDAARYVRIVQNELSKNPKLKECTPRSFMGAVLTGAQLGLEPGPMQQWYPVPYRNHGVAEVQFIVGYRGWAALAHRTGQIQGINPRTVFKGDEFDYAYGLDEYLVHKPTEDEKRGAPLYYYVVTRLTNGGRNFVVMSRPEVERHRDRYAKKNGQVVGPWADPGQFEAMAWKTCFLKQKAWLPSSIEVMQADAMDGHTVNRMDPEEEPDVVPFDDDEIVDAEIVETDAERKRREADEEWQRQGRNTGPGNDENGT